MENNKSFKPNPKKKLLEQVREVLRYYHYSYRTEIAYCNWIVKFIKYHGGKTYPKTMEKNEIESYLSYLVSEKNVSSASQRQALNAIVFLFKRFYFYQFRRNCHRFDQNVYHDRLLFVLQKR